MRYIELLQKKNDFNQALTVDNVLSNRSRSILRKILFAVLSLFALLLIISILPETMSSWFGSFGEILNKIRNQLLGIFTFLLIPFIFLNIIEAMFTSIRFRQSGLTYDVAKILEQGSSRDITGSFLQSEMGMYAMGRLGISGNEIKDYLSSRTLVLDESKFEITPDKEGIVDLKQYGLSVFNSDQSLRDFIRSRTITEELFKGALAWISRISYKYYDNRRWWTKDKLDRMPGLGKNISFGQIYLLDKYGHSIYSDTTYNNLGEKYKVHKEHVEKVEQILVKDSGANVVLISEAVSIGKEIVSALAKDILNGTSLPQLEDKRIFVLDITTIIDSVPNKSEVENTLIKILNQSSKAGNVVLVIPDLPAFIQNASVIGADVSSILSEALSSNNLQIVALTESHEFHEGLESNLELMRNFEQIIIEDLDTDSAIQFIEEEILHIEARDNIFFTYPALVAFVDSAKRYFSSALLSDKVIDLLHEIVPVLKSKNIRVVLPNDIYELVEDKTGIPLGAVTEKEKDLLENLETILHQKVIGQDIAVSQVAKALRRSRAGITNQNRPLGSLLFLGPTGVGKTETTKALADVYFRGSAKMMRFDMSEYNGADALSKLIGSHGSANQGILSSTLRESQYGVLLLDEFEKASPDVHDLFLQIIDEGMFTDGRGDKVNARNTIIIATSNAGSDLIYDAAEKGIDLTDKNSEIIDSIIERGIFKPELINRFDSVVLFHSLGKPDLMKIADLMITKLNERMKEKAIVIKSTQALLDYLIVKGYDRQFGARAMNRVIQDEIESIIADSIIAGSIKPGDTVEFILNESGALVAVGV